MEAFIHKDDMKKLREMVYSVLFRENGIVSGNVRENGKIVAFLDDFILAMGGYESMESNRDTFSGWYDCRHLPPEILGLDVHGMDDLIGFSQGSGLPMGIVIKDDHYRMEELKNLGDISGTPGDDMRVLDYTGYRYSGEIRIYKPRKMPILADKPMFNNFGSYGQN